MRIEGPAMPIHPPAASRSSPREFHGAGALLDAVDGNGPRGSPPREEFDRLDRQRAGRLDDDYGLGVAERCVAAQPREEPLLDGRRVDGQRRDPRRATLGDLDELA